MIEDSIFFKTVDEKFPQIGKKIKLFWGHPEFVALVYELQHDTGDRDRVRAGFPADVLMALHEMEIDHNMIWPHLARRDANIWTIDSS